VEHLFLIVLLLLNGNKEFSQKLIDINDAICMVESQNNPNAIGDKNYQNYSVGLGQIRLETGKWLIRNIIPNNKIKIMLKEELKRIGIKKMLLNKEINRYLGRHYLLWLYQIHNKNWKKAIISYNTGHRASKKIRNSSGLKYYKKVKLFMKIMKKI